MHNSLIYDTKSQNMQSVHQSVSIHQQLFTSPHYLNQGAGHANNLQICIVWHRLVLIQHPNAEIFQKDITTVYCIGVLRSACAPNGASDWLKAAPHALSQEVSGG